MPPFATATVPVRFAALAAMLPEIALPGIVAAAVMYNQPGSARFEELNLHFSDGVVHQELGLPWLGRGNLRRYVASLTWNVFLSAVFFSL